IDIELTANRGDCDSIHGVARDLCAAFGKELKSFDFEVKSRNVLGVAREFQVSSSCNTKCFFCYTIVESDGFKSDFLERLRLGFIKNEAEDNLERTLAYAKHESGVILRAYDYNKLRNGSEEPVSFDIVECENSTIEVRCCDKVVSIAGVNQNADYKADKNGQKVLVEASYVDPEFVVEGVSRNKLESDELYYNSSRGSETDLAYGMKKLQQLVSELNSEVTFSSGEVVACEAKVGTVISIKTSEINAIIGSDIPKIEIINILKRLEFKVHKVDDDIFAVTIPPFRHDIKNIQDIAEEVLRIYGIDNIEDTPLCIVEANRINDTYLHFKELRDIRERAVAANFFEALTYAFANKELLQKYGFELIDDSLELLNPIVKELSTLRTTLLVNLLEAAGRNVKYGKKRIALFEAGTIFNAKREERESLGFLLSGEEQRANVHNSATAEMVGLDSFVQKIGAVIGEFTLEPIEAENGLMHPYISAAIIKGGERVGYLAKLHPKVAGEFSLKDTFIAEVALEKVMPQHINAHALSNFQAVTKDLSVLIEKSLSFYKVAKVLQELRSAEPLLRDFYPLDIYEDESLGEKKSLTIRFTLQSDTATLSEQEMESLMATILESLKSNFAAELR
ncbi:MAG TPA: phenylalanine--tRNA ligase subunit beta, partial [Nitratifractor sp.]|nr:phenylalanine--tRNA ligase subunit beta [Nitratifractor sp.]